MCVCVCVCVFVLCLLFIIFLSRVYVYLIFDLIFIIRRGIVMDYLCAEFGDFSFSRLGFIVRTDRQTES